MFIYVQKKNKLGLLKERFCGGSLPMKVTWWVGGARDPRQKLSVMFLLVAQSIFTNEKQTLLRIVIHLCCARPCKSRVG